MSTDDINTANQSNGQLILDAALTYAKHGLPVFPCWNRPGDKKKHKTPLIEGGFHNATIDSGLITEWWSKWPTALIAMPAGKLFTVLDLDVKNNKNGLAVVQDWQQRSPLIGCTGNGGRHLYFGPDDSITCTSDEIALGVDTRGTGGYVIVAPSPGYTWFNGHNLLNFDLTQLPPWPNDLRIAVDSDPHVAADELMADDPALVPLALEAIANPDLGWDAWNRIGMATWVASGGSEEGLLAFDTFSRKSEKYRERETRDQWRGYGRSPPTRIGFGTLYYLASEASPDWRAEYNAEQEAEAQRILAGETQSNGNRPPFKEWTYDEFKNLKPRRFLIGDKDRPVLIEGGLWAYFGFFKHGKTFFAMEVAFCVAFDLSFYGLPVVAGNVVYVSAEGGVESAFERLQALFEKYKDELDGLGYDSIDAVLNAGRFNLITSAVDITKPESIKVMLGQLVNAPYSLVCLDTWTRMLSAGGGHDSDPVTVAKGIRGMDNIRQTLDCTVALVSHVGWAAQDRMKGMIDLPGALDGATHCVKQGEPPNEVFSFESTYQRHAIEGFRLHMRLKPSGPSQVLVTTEPLPEADEESSQRRTAADRILEAVLDVVFDGPGMVTITPPSSPSSVRAVYLAVVRKEFDQGYVVIEDNPPNPKKVADAKRKAFGRALDRLHRGVYGIGEVDGVQMVWLVIDLSVIRTNMRARESK